MTPTGTVERGTARVRLLDAALDVIRRQGLSATTIDDLCAAAGVTKGAVFHHFETKEALAVAAAEHWSTTTSALFAAADYHQLPDPFDRILGYLDLRAQLIAGTPAEYSCLAGTMVQEAFLTHPDVRDACAVSILGHAATLETDFAAALAAIDAPPQLDVASLARYTQVVLQGAFLVSKAANDSAVVLDAIAHLRRYLEAVFHRPTNKEEPVVSTPPTARRRRRAAPVTALDKEIISQQVGDPVTVTIERRIDG